MRQRHLPGSWLDVVLSGLWAKSALYLPSWAPIAQEQTADNPIVAPKALIVREPREIKVMCCLATNVHSYLIAGVQEAVCHGQTARYGAIRHALTDERTFADEWTKQIWLWIKLPLLA
jgi:hypothetical protein